MRLIVCLMAATVTAAMTAPSVRADIGAHVYTKAVAVHGVIRGWSNGSGMPLYLVPEHLAERPYTCKWRGHRAYCRPQVRRPPRAPYVLLGRLRPIGMLRGQKFAFRVPRVIPGRHQLVIWCRSCGGSLILAGQTLQGEVLRIFPAGTDRPAKWLHLRLLEGISPHALS
jgi:hypothetical protein